MNDDVTPANGMTPEEFRWWVGAQFKAIFRELKGIQDSIEVLTKRIEPLEQLRSMVIGATVVIVSITPLVWWLLTKVAEKGGKP